MLDRKKVVYVLTLLWLSFWAVLLLHGVVAAEPLRDAASERLATKLAIVSSHEGALKSLRDVDLVWQVTLYNAKTTPSRIHFLEAHSGRALGVKPCLGGNCEWSTQMNSRGTIPASVAATDVPYWRSVVIPRWQKVLSHARALVAGARFEKPCAIEPRTWGSVVLDSKKAAANGLYPIGCQGTANDGFAPRKAFLEAGVTAP